MLSIYLIAWVIFYCILGFVIIIRPDKIKYKISQASSATIRWWGFIIFCAGIWLAIAVVLFNYALTLPKLLGQ